jgi:hypothetical protein
MVHFLRCLTVVVDAQARRPRPRLGNLAGTGGDTVAGLIWALIVVLAIAWFLGFAVNVGWWINVLLVLIVLGIIYQLVIAPLLLTRRTTGTGRTIVREEREYDDRDLP